MARTKMTPEEKAEAKLAREAEVLRLKQELEEKEARAASEWQLVKREKWLESLLKVEGLWSIIFNDFGEYRDLKLKENYDWFFDDFGVNIDYDSLENSRFSCPYWSNVKFDIFSQSTYKNFCDSLIDSEQYIKDVADHREAERRKEEELANKRSQALSKLTAEEKKLLGL